MYTVLLSTNTAFHIPVVVVFSVTQDIILFTSKTLETVVYQITLDIHVIVLH